MKAQEEPSWSAHILTLFPEMFPGPLGQSIAGRALEQNKWALSCYPLREFGLGKHKDVDAPACGGGVGLVMRPDAVGPAIEHVLSQTGADTARLYPSPRGRKLDHTFIRSLAQKKNVLFVCGRYEGLDERVIDHYQLEEVSIGDYVLSGGEIAALTIIDAIVRVLDGVMGKAEGHEQDSFENGLLEHPQYTIPRSWQGKEVPPVLLSGHHAQISSWKLEMAKQITQERRPDLWEAFKAETKQDI